MQVRTSSWHYRFLEWRMEYSFPPRNLCPYMRALMWHILKFSLIVAFCALVGGMVLWSAGVTAAVAIDQWITPILPSYVTWNVDDTGWNAAFTIGCLIWVVGALIGAIFLYFTKFEDTADDIKYAVREKWNEYKAAQRDKPRNIVVAWLIALHEKTCPQLDFVYDNK